MNIFTLYYKIKKGNVEVKDYIEWALAMLSDGLSSPSVNILASFSRDANVFEVDDYFQRARKELDLGIPSFEKCARAYIADLAQTILRMGPIKGTKIAKEIAEVVMTELDYPEDLIEWYGISEMSDRLVYDRSQLDFDDKDLQIMIVDEAKILVGASKEGGIN